MKKTLSLLTFLVLASSGSRGLAASLSWDPGATPVAPSGGSGSWDLVTPVWSNATSDVAWTDSTGFFDTAAFASSGGTVTLSGSLGAKGVSFFSTGYSLSGGSLSIGSSGIDATSLTSGNGAAITSNLTIVSGQSWAVPTGATLTLSSGTFTRVNKAVLGLSGAGAVASSLTGLANDTSENSGILGAWITTGSGTTANYATLSAGSITGYTYTSTGASTAIPSTTTAATNYKVITAGTGTYGAATRTLNVLYNTVGASTLTFGNSTTVIQLIANGILNAGTGVLTVSRGGTNAASGVQIGTTKELVLNAANSGITITSPIANNSSGASGVTSTATGANLVTLSGVSTYTGATTIGGGTLTVNGTGAINTSSGIAINGNGAKYLHASSVASTVPIAVTNGTLDGTGAVGAVTVTDDTGGIVTNGNGGTTALTLASLSFNGGATVNPKSAGTTAGIVVTGALTTTGANGSVVLNASNAWSSGTTYNLISYGSFSGNIADFTKGTLTGLGPRQSATLVNTGTAIAVAIAGDKPAWTGAVSGEWSTNVIGGAKNWKLATAGTPTDFLAGDEVLFDDSATGTTSVNISAANVTTATVNVNTSSKVYTIGSSGGFGISSGTLTKSGTSNLILTSTNTYTGATTISGGTLTLGDGITDGTIAGTSGVTNNGALVYNWTTDHTAAYAITGTGTLTKQGVGILTLTGAGTFSGGTTISNGTIALTGTGALGTGAISLASGTLLDNLSNYALAAAVSGSGQIRSTGGVVSGNFSGFTGTFTHNSSFASSSFSTTTATSRDAAYVIAQAQGSSQGLIATTPGDSTLELGSLAGVANSLFRGGNAVSGTTTLQIGNLNTSTTFGGLFANGATKIIAVNKVGTGTLTLTGASTHTGITTINGGTLQLGDGTTDGTIATTSGVTNNATLAYNWSAAHTAAYVISGTGKVTKDGAGTLSLTGANTFTGGTFVNAGKVAVNGASLADGSPLTINGGQVDLTGTEVVGALFFASTQQPSGTYGATGSGATHIDNTHFSGTGLLSVTGGSSAYDTWASGAGLTVANNGSAMDPDNDGISNLLEYVLGGDPLSNNRTILPFRSDDATSINFSFTRSDASETDVQLNVQWSTDLVNWTNIPVGAGDSAGVTVLEGGGADDIVTVVIPKSNAVNGKLFVRLKATK